MLLLAELQKEQKEGSEENENAERESEREMCDVEKRQCTRGEAADVQETRRAQCKGPLTPTPAPAAL